MRRSTLLLVLLALASAASARKLLEVKEGAVAEGDEGYQVEINNDVVTIKLSLEKDDDGLEMGPIMVAQTYTTQRFVPLSVAVDISAAKASFEKGVLTVELPRRAEDGKAEDAKAEKGARPGLAEVASELARSVMERSMDQQRIDDVRSRMQEYGKRAESRWHNLMDRLLPRIQGFLQGHAQAPTPAIAEACDQFEGDERAACLVHIIERMEATQHRRMMALEAQAKQMARQAAISGFLAATALVLFVSMIAHCVRSLDRRGVRDEAAQPPATSVPAAQPPAPAPTALPPAPSAPAPAPAAAPSAPRVYLAAPQPAAAPQSVVDAPLGPEAAAVPALQPVPVFPQLAPPAQNSNYGPAPTGPAYPAAYNPYMYPAPYQYQWPAQAAAPGQGRPSA